MKPIIDAEQKYIITARELYEITYALVDVISWKKGSVKRIYDVIDKVRERPV